MTAVFSERMSLDVAWRQAIAHHQAGRLPEAEKLYRAILHVQPGHPDANHNLGVLAGQVGQLAAGLPYLKAALAINSSNPQYILSYAEALIVTGQSADALELIKNAMRCGLNSDAARSLLQKAQIALDDSVKDGELPSAEKNQLITLFNTGRHVELEARSQKLVEDYPNSGLAWKILASALQMQGKDAIHALQRASKLLSDDADLHVGLGNAFRQIGQLDDAIACYRLALKINPDYAEVHNNLGNAFREIGQLDQAVASYHRALELKPVFAAGHSNLGNVLQDLGCLDDAAASHRRAIAIDPNFIGALDNLANVLMIQGKLDEAADYYRKFLALSPNSAVRVKCDLMLPPIMGTRVQVEQSRSQFEKNLDRLMEDRLMLVDPCATHSASSFYLAFQGYNDKSVQQKVAKFYEQSCPELLYVAAHCARPRTPHRKMKIGFLSKYIHDHSVSRCFNRILEGIAQESKFEVFLISQTDALRDFNSRASTNFKGEHVHLPRKLDLAHEKLAALELDVLIYLDIGMDPFSYFLAFSRLARVQCVAGGHPVTTGIRNMDFFLSSELSETADADEHYSEKLVRLPLGMFYFERPALPVKYKTRGELGLPIDGHIYLCPMALQKMHPDFDDAIARILQLDANGYVVLFHDEFKTTWHELLVNRFAQTIPDYLRDRIKFLPWIKDYSDFISMNAMSDVILDPFHFGIGSTAIATFSVGTPIVTKPSEFMRGRVGLLYCKLLDIPECVAFDAGEYAQKAVSIACDVALRESIKAKIFANDISLFENDQAIEDVKRFFLSLREFEPELSQ